MANKTAMQELLEWVVEFEDVASYHDNDYGDGMVHVLSAIKNQILSKQEKEKQQIVEAYDTEKHELCGCKVCDFCIDVDDSLKPNGEQYYTETYETN